MKNEGACEVKAENADADEEKEEGFPPLLEAREHIAHRTILENQCDPQSDDHTDRRSHPSLLPHRSRRSIVEGVGTDRPTWQEEEEEEAQEEEAEEQEEEEGQEEEEEEDSTTSSTPTTA